MSVRRRLVVGTLVAALGCHLAAPAEVPAKQSKVGKQARRFEKKGKKAYAKKRWDDAVAAFRLAYEADPQPRFLFNVARCLAKKGDLPQALQYLEQYIAEETNEEERADGAAELRILEARLETSFARLMVVSKPKGARVVVRGQGREIPGTTPLSRWLPVGSWHVRVSADGHEEWTQEVLAEAGRPLNLVARLKAEGAAAAEPAPEKEAETKKRRKKRRKPKPPPTAAAEGGSPVPWLVLGGGGALAAGGAVFGVLAGSARDERDALKGAGTTYDAYQEKQETAKSRALVANVLYVAGGVAAATGVVLLLLDDGGAEAAAGRVRLTPSPAGLGLAVEWTP